MVYHHYRQPTEGLEELEVDLVILNFCFLSRRNTDEFRELLDEYSVLTRLGCPIVAVPQDDFSCSALLDEWLYAYRVHSIFTPRSEGHELIYPNAGRAARLRRVLPGYVDEEIAAQVQSDLRPWRERTIDLGTRVRFHPFQHGWFGRLKGQEALHLAEQAEAAGFVVDVSTRDDQVLLGLDWYRFLGRCRFTVARRGGSSLVDPYGLVKQRIEGYTRHRPDASFAEVEEACYPGEDLERPLTAMTPRVLDAALTGTCLILPRDDYESLLEPWEHYVPFPEDDAQLREVLDAMRDEALAERLVAATREAVVESGRFSYRRFVDRVTEPLDESRPTRRGAQAYGRYRNRLEELPRKSGSFLFEAALELLGRRMRGARLDEIERASQSSWTAHRVGASGGLARGEAEVLRELEHVGALDALGFWARELSAGRLHERSLRRWYFEGFEAEIASLERAS